MVPFEYRSFFFDQSTFIYTASSPDKRAIGNNIRRLFLCDTPIGHNFRSTAVGESLRKQDHGYREHADKRVAPPMDLNSSSGAKVRHLDDGDGSSQFSEINPLAAGDCVSFASNNEPKVPQTIAKTGWQRTVAKDSDFDSSIPVVMGVPGTGLVRCVVCWGWFLRCSDGMFFIA